MTRHSSIHISIVGSQLVDKKNVTEQCKLKMCYSIYGLYYKFLI
jgi:hypothetical protein